MNSGVPVSEGQERPAESAGCTMGISMALGALVLAMIGTLALLLGPGMLEQELPIEETLAQTFKQGRAPFGLLESGSRSYVKRADVLRLIRAGLDEERQTQRLEWEQWEEPDKGAGNAGLDDESSQAETENQGPLGMAALERVPGSVDPDELLIVCYAEVKLLIEAFKTKPSGGFGDSDADDGDEEASRRQERWKKNAVFAWETTLKRDKVRWDGWEADFHIDRHFRLGGAWHDSLKLNLGLGERNLAVYAQWPAGYVVTVLDVQRVARTIKM